MHYIYRSNKDWCWSWNSNTLATWCKELTHLKRPWCWERLRLGDEGNDTRWDGWMASPTQWTWTWVDSGSWQWKGRPGVLQLMGSQRVRHDWETELNWNNHKKRSRNQMQIHIKIYVLLYFSFLFYCINMIWIWNKQESLKLTERHYI